MGNKPLTISKNLEKTDEKKNIFIKGARVHNLKNVDVTIPRNKFVVITGVSGSGKSSLAFDTLYAEGQRRYVESLSAYARQFLGRIEKPAVDYIKGISPAIAIEQKVTTRNPRSTVGTTTEIYDYLKLLFARVGKTYSPVSGNIVKRHTVQDVVDEIISKPDNAKIQILSKISIAKNKNSAEQLQLLLQQGFSRIKINDETKRLDELVQAKISASDSLYLIIDRIVLSKDDDDLMNRIADSVQTAFFEGEGECTIEYLDEKKNKLKIFSNKFELDGITFEEPNVHFFSFNNPIGACKHCEGFGSVIGIDENLVIPNKNLSVYEDAIVCWRGERMSEWKNELLKVAHKFDFPVHKPIIELSEKNKKLLWSGNEYFGGLNKFFKHLEEQAYKIQYRVMLSRYRGKTICPECQGTRLRKDASYVKVSGKSISELILQPAEENLLFFKHIKLNETEKQIAKRIVVEITNRLQFLVDVGLGYLTLNRLSNTLSGGESQRINLATSLGSSLVGSMYILDEPSIGLHSRDTERLIGVLKSLKNIGNTVIVVEHDEEIIRASDVLIDMGPLAGTLGGEVVFAGDHNDILTAEKSLTAAYLTGKEKIDIPSTRRKASKYIEILGARENNLKNLNVKFPLQSFVVVTGVSGSGKSSLIKKVLYPAVKKLFGGYNDLSGTFDNIKGDINSISTIEFIDQNPIGKSSRSNPVTYVKAYDEIRALFAEQPLAKMRGYKPSHFSFNVDGGRCETCEGEGEVEIAMQFMADIHLTCEDCNGKRFKQDVLEIKYKEKNIADILELTIDEAIDFFSTANEKNNTDKRIISKIKPLQDVGLGYVHLGQASSTLSGGEAQRIKLASFLGMGQSTTSPTLFVFDEPTTGLHFHDIKKLLYSFNALIDQGHSILVIEHNMDIIKCADWIIDLGPEGGDKGGNIIFEGTPEELIKNKISYTAKYLKDKMNGIN
ncbi:MAG: excinuclease ABC subunit UvrA [Bacteroidetes bacterium]|nr:excinuclease ABC subunit UvrA [Bacteroidota bacterium]